jgi:hypothetical protein
MLVSANRSNNQANLYPTQRVNKSFLAECYPLQDTWFDNPSCLQHIYSSVILDSWETEEVHITEITDPRLLAA